MLPHQGHVVESAVWSKPEAVGCGLALQLVLTGTAPVKPNFNSWSNSSFILTGGILATACSSQTLKIFVCFPHPDGASSFIYAALLCCTLLFRNQPPVVLLCSEFLLTDFEPLTWELTASAAPPNTV